MTQSRTGKRRIHNCKVFFLGLALVTWAAIIVRSLQVPDFIYSLVTESIVKDFLSDFTEGGGGWPFQSLTSNS
jgi:hypothetical protein